MTMPIMSVRRVMKLRSIAFGLYPSVSAACTNFAVVSSATRVLALKTRDTVDCETPASRATSIDVTGRLAGLPVYFARLLNAIYST